jgi:pyruvyl transferase EpsO
MYESVAWRRVERGCDILSRGRVVITDRLHGHLLCLLLGIDHVILDNNYGKVSRFHREWTSGIGRALLCSRAEDAPAAARQLLEATR